MFSIVRGRAPARPGLALVAGLLLAVTGPPGASAQPARAAGATLNLDDALARAGAADPSSAGWDARLAAAQAGVRQAGVKPNPSLGVDLENFAGSGSYSMLDRTEATLSYQQTLERGGKREARVGLARAGAEVLRRRRDVRRLDLLRDVQLAYAEALAAEAELLIADARLIAAQSAQADVDRRVRAARDPLFAGSRAGATTAQAEIDRDQARATAANARSALARFWGGSGAVTDPTVRAGVRYLGDGDDVALVVGGTLPLRLHDDNKGAIERAISERSAAEADIASERILREREIARLTARMAASAAESERLRAEVIPLSIRAVEQVRDGFNRGGFQYANVADAERALSDARARRVAVLKQFHLDQAALDRLTGRHAALASSNLNAERR